MKRDRLVDGRLLRYSYLIIGLSQFFTCTAAFFLTTNYYGIPGSFFLNNRDSWTSDADPLTVNGTVFSGEQQEDVWRRGVAAFYLTLVLCQGWHVFLTKTRAQSIFKHGIFRNRQSVYGVLAAIALGCFFVYVPGVQNLFDTRNPSFWPWVCHFMFPLVFLPFTEYSKWKVRHQPTSWWARHVAW
jgi:magnesium-transporting ATPase (P-type)